MRLKHKKMALFLLLLIIPIATIISLNADDDDDELEVIDFIIYLRNEEAQAVVDELIYKAESLGLCVNAIYLNAQEIIARALSGDYDLCYGPAIVLNKIDNIFSIVAGLAYFEQVIMHSDAKFTKIVDKLVNYYYAAQTTPEEKIPRLINKMIKKFHKAEKILWQKQLYIPIAQSLNAVSYPGFAVTMGLFFNSQTDRIFDDDDLRISYSSIIDRSLIVDYWTTQDPSTYEAYHFWGWSSHHDFDLPNYFDDDDDDD